MAHRSVYLCIEKDYTKNEHLYLTVLSALRCNRIHYAINVLESILMNDPGDILCINTLHMLYKMLGEGSRMVGTELSDFT